MVLPYISNDTAIACKKSRFILSEIKFPYDDKTVNSTFPVPLSALLSVDKILLPSYGFGLMAHQSLLVI